MDHGNQTVKLVVYWLSAGFLFSFVIGVFGFQARVVAAQEARPNNSNDYFRVISAFPQDEFLDEIEATEEQRSIIETAMERKRNLSKKMAELRERDDTEIDWKKAIQL